MPSFSKPHFPRTQYAKEFAEQLLSNIPGGTVYSSGVFISGIRRVGKSVFVQRDLMPEIERQQAVAVYVDLAAAKENSISVAQAIRSAIDRRFEQDSIPAKNENGPSAVGRLVGFLRKRITPDVFHNFETKSIEITQKVIGNAAVLGGETSITKHLEKTEIDVQAITLRERIERLIDLNKKSVVLIVDEVQIALESQNGKGAMWALKSARDIIDNNINSSGRFLFVGTGSQRSMVNSMAARRSEAYYGAATETFRCLGDDFLHWYQAERLKSDPSQKIPSVHVLAQGFAVLGNRPERLTAVIDSIRHSHGNIDDQFLAACDLNVSFSNDTESIRLRELGDLCCAIFDRICMSTLKTKASVYDKAASSYYNQCVGTEVASHEVQAALNKLIANNFVYAVGAQLAESGGTQGHYHVVDENFAAHWNQMSKQDPGDQENDALAPKA